MGATVLTTLAERIPPCVEYAVETTEHVVAEFESRMPERSRPAFRLLKMLWEAELHLQRGELAEARSVVHAARQAWIDEANSLLAIRCRLALRLGQRQEALADLLLMQWQGRMDLQDTLLLAWLQYQLGLLDECQAILETATSEYPESAEVWNMYGYVCLRKGSPFIALSAFDKAITKNRQYVDAWHNRGFAYATMGKYETAIDDLDVAISLHPMNIAALLDRAAAHLMTGDLDRARGDLDLAEQLNRRTAAIGGSLIYRSKLLSLEGDVDAARKLAKEARKFPAAFDSVLVDTGFLDALE